MGHHPTLCHIHIQHLSPSKNHFFNYLLYAREPLSPMHTLLPYIDNTSLDSYTEDILCRPKEAPKLSRIHTFKSQPDHVLRYSDTHIPVEYNVGDEVLLWKPSRSPHKCDKVLKKFKRPFRILRRVSSINYKVAPVSPPPDHRSHDTDIDHVARLKCYHRIDPSRRRPAVPRRGSILLRR